MKLANFTHHLRKILSFFTITKVINVNNEIRRVNCFFQIEDWLRNNGDIIFLATMVYRS